MGRNFGLYRYLVLWEGGIATTDFRVEGSDNLLASVLEIGFPVVELRRFM